MARNHPYLSMRLEQEQLKAQQIKQEQAALHDNIRDVGVSVLVLAACVFILCVWRNRGR